MSIFGSRNKTTVGTSVARVIDDYMLPDSIRQGATEAIMDKSSQTTEYVMDALVGGLALKVDRMYRYGRDHYINGLPQGTTYSSVTGRAVVEQAVEADIGLVDSISYYHLAPVNLLHLGWLQLVRDYGYDSSTNAFTVAGQVVYLTNMQPVVVESNFTELESGSMDQWGTPPHAGYSPKRKHVLAASASLEQVPAFLVDPNAVEDYIRVQYAWEVEVDKVVEGLTIKVVVVKTAEMNLPTTGVSLSANYFQVRYLKGGKAGYWMYQMNSGVKPAVDAIFNTAPNMIGTFYPWTYFRFDKQPITTNKTSPEYLSNKKLLKKISMDLDDITDGIHENPDIGDVEQAMLMLAVPAKTTNEIERRYLFDFFTKMHTSAAANGGAGAPSSSQIARLGSLFNKPVTATTIVIRDKKFKMALTFSSIIKRRVAGNFGNGLGQNAKPGEHHSGTNIDTSTKKVENVAGMEVVWATNTPIHYYRRQITENLYEELVVANLKMTYWIWGDYTDTAEELEPALLIPLDFEIVETYQILDREKLYGRSLHYIFNSRVVTKLKWYQTGIFRAVLIVVAVVITIVTYGATIKGLIAAIAAGGAAATAAYYAIATFLWKYLVVTLLVRLFVKTFGAKVAFIIAIVAAVFGMYQVMANGGSIAGAPWAKELLVLSSNMSSGAMKGFQGEYQDILADFEKFNREKETKQDALDKLNAQLDNSNHLSPVIIWGETPDEFYQRTVHSGNIGMVGIDAISSFVDMKLQLPKLSDTLGDFV